MTVSSGFTGVLPLYYVQSSSQFTVAPSIGTLLEAGASTELDDQALALFLRLGYFVDDRTPFRHIRAFPPSMTYQWPSEAPPLDSHPSFQTRTLTLREAKAEYLRLVHDSIVRRLPPDEAFAMPLSGGRDSRHILLELLGLGARPKFCYTTRVYPPRQTRDVEIAAQLARVLGVNHEVFDPDPSRVRAELTKNRLTDFCADEHAWGIDIPTHLGPRVSTIYDGINGGVLFGRIGQADQYRLFAQGNFEQLALDVLRSPVGERSLQLVLRPDLQRKWSLDAATDLLSRSLAQFANEPNPVQAFYFWNRVRRSTARFTFGVLRGLNVICPLLDSKLVSFALSLPAAVSSFPNFQEEALRERFPACSQVPFDRPLPNSRGRDGTYARRYALEMLPYLVRNSSSSIIRGPVLRQLMRTLVNGRLSSLDWLAPEKVLYLSQLETILEEKP